MTLIAEGTSFAKSYSEDYLIDTRITEDLLAEQKFQKNLNLRNEEWARNYTHVDGMSKVTTRAHRRT
jgi:hypothetical protein